MLTPRSYLERVIGQPGPLGSNLYSAERRSAEFNRSLRDFISVLLELFRGLIKEFVECNEARPFDVPVRLFGLKPEVERVGEVLVE